MIARHRLAGPAFLLGAFLLGAGAITAQNPAAQNPPPQVPAVQAPAPQNPPPQNSAAQAPAPQKPAAQNPPPQVPAPQNPLPQNQAAQAPAPQNQTPGRLNSQQAGEMIGRCLQLMESTVTVLPNLKASSVSLIADARSTMEDLQRTPGNSAFTYHFLNDVQAYLQLTDILPRPADLPLEGQRQLNELHDDFGRLETWFRQLLIAKEAQLRSPDRDNVRRYATDNQSLQSATASRVLFFGDSITDFWRLNEYFPGKDYVNRGISGQVTSEMLGRMKPDVVDVRPKAMILLAGTNDLSRGTELKTIENNIIAMTELAKANNIKVLLCSILPVSDYHKTENPRFEMSKTHDPQLIRQVNQWMQGYCRSGTCTYVDYFSAMVDSAGLMQSDLADDGLHPNAKGYRIMAPIAQKALDDVIRPAPVAPAAAPAPEEKKHRFNPFGKQ
jgi:lysophospholipase L1-like esterase